MALGRIPGIRVMGVMVGLAMLLIAVLYGGQFGTHSKPASGVIEAATANTIEDTFTRSNQMGWGTTTNPDGVPNVSWGMDGNGSKSFVSLNNNTGVYAYPGALNVVGIASAGSTTSNGGDSLVKFKVSAVGHVTPYVVQNACPDKSCYYGARLHTSQNKLELAKRSGNATNILASVPFTATANTFYWMRLDVATGISDTLQARIWKDAPPSRPPGRSPRPTRARSAPTWREPGAPGIKPGRERASCMAATPLPPAAGLRPVEPARRPRLRRCPHHLPRQLRRCLVVLAPLPAPPLDPRATPSKTPSRAPTRWGGARRPTPTASRTWAGA